MLINISITIFANFPIANLGFFSETANNFDIFYSKKAAETKLKSYFR